MKRLPSKVQCNGCGAQSEGVLYDAPLSGPGVIANTLWMRPPRGWFMCMVILKPGEQQKIANVVVCPSCMALGRVQRNVEKGDSRQGSGERLPDEVLPPEKAEDV